MSSPEQWTAEDYEEAKSLLNDPELDDEMYEALKTSIADYEELGTLGYRSPGEHEDLGMTVGEGYFEKEPMSVQPPDRPVQLGETRELRPKAPSRFYGMEGDAERLEPEGEPFLYDEPSLERAKQILLEESQRVEGPDQQRRLEQQLADLESGGKASETYKDIAEWTWRQTLGEFKEQDAPVIRSSVDEMAEEEPWYSRRNRASLAGELSPYAGSFLSGLDDMATLGIGGELATGLIGNRVYDDKTERALAELESSGVMPTARQRTEAMQEEHPGSSLLGSLVGLLSPMGLAGVVGHWAGGGAVPLGKGVPKLLQQAGRGALGAAGVGTAMRGVEAAGDVVAGEEPQDLTEGLGMDLLLGSGMSTLGSALSPYARHLRNPINQKGRDLSTLEDAGGGTSMNPLRSGGVRPSEGIQDLITKAESPQAAEALEGIPGSMRTFGRKAPEDIAAASLARGAQSTGAAAEAQLSAKIGDDVAKFYAGNKTEGQPTETFKTVLDVLRQREGAMFNAASNELKGTLSSVSDISITVGEQQAATLARAKKGVVLSPLEAVEMGLGAQVRKIAQRDGIPTIDAPGIKIVLSPKKQNIRTMDESVQALERQIREGAKVKGSKDPAYKQIEAAILKDRDRLFGPEWAAKKVEHHGQLSGLETAKRAVGVQPGQSFSPDSAEQFERAFDALKGYGDVGRVDDEVIRAFLSRNPKLTQELRQFAGLKAYGRLQESEPYAGGVISAARKTAGRLGRSADAAAGQIRRAPGEAGAAISVITYPDFVTQMGPQGRLLFDRMEEIAPTIQQAPPPAEEEDMFDERREDHL